MLLWLMGCLPGGRRNGVHPSPTLPPCPHHALPDFVMDCRQVGGAKALADDFAEAPSVTKGLLAAGAVAGASVLLFSQVRCCCGSRWRACLPPGWHPVLTACTLASPQAQAELLFEVAGLFAAGQFLVKMLFAEEREKALTEIKCAVDLGHHLVVVAAG